MSGVVAGINGGWPDLMEGERDPRERERVTVRVRGKRNERKKKMCGPNLLFIVWPLGPLV